jgi:hypothetical protein
MDGKKDERKLIYVNAWAKKQQGLRMRNEESLLPSPRLGRHPLSPAEEKVKIILCLLLCFLTSGVIWTIFFTLSLLTSGVGSFFSVAMTTPSLALMPREVAPWLTAFSACSI